MIQLGVFAKYWQSGEVKTRLAQSIGSEGAAALYHEFLICLLARFAAFGDRRSLLFTPEERESDFEAIGASQWQTRSQVSGNLGVRMRSQFEFWHEQPVGETSVGLLIGSDSPNLPAALLSNAVERLRTVPVVLGPSDDGGYYLIGLRGEAATPPVLDALFERMPWSEPNLLETTTQRLRHQQIEYQLIEPWYDVDELSDLLRLHRELSDPVLQKPALVRLRRVVADVLDRYAG